MDIQVEARAEINEGYFGDIIELHVGTLNMQADRESKTPQEIPTAPIDDNIVLDAIENSSASQGDTRKGYKLVSVPAIRSALDSQKTEYEAKG